MRAIFAAMAELADALDSGSSRGNSVKVQLLLAAISYPAASASERSCRRQPILFPYIFKQDTAR